MGWRLFKRRPKNKFFLCLDIGTETVKALIFSLSSDFDSQKPAVVNEGRSSKEQRRKKKEKIVILGTGLEYFDKDTVFDSRDFEAEVIKRTISKAVEKAHQNLSFSLADKELKKRAQKQKKWQVLLGLPPDLLKGRIDYQSFLREKPKEKISKKEEKNIYHNILESVKGKISQRFTEEVGILPADIQWLSLKILEIKIDGYLVSDLKGYEGKDLEFKILATFLPEYYWENIKKIIGSLGFKILKTIHLAESLPIVCKDEKSDGLFLDVGGEITQIFEIKSGKLQKITEFKGGGRAFTQSLSQTLGIDEEAARIMEEKYSKKVLSSGAIEKIKEIFSWERKIWYDNLKVQLRKINARGIFPSTFFLFGGGSSTPEIQKVFEEEAINDWENLPISGPPKVEFIYPEDLKNVKDTTKILNKSQSVPSLLICCGILADN